MERETFAARETRGFTDDLKALKEHILKLQNICPKDKAGWPVGNALSSIRQLQNDYNRFTRYLDQTR